MRFQTFLIPFLVSTILSTAALASFSGDWVGWGSWKFKGEGEGVSCSPMQITWAESATEISIEKGNFECEVVAMELFRTAWERRGAKLHDAEGNEVGTYDGENFEVYMPSPNAYTTIHLQVKRAANHIDYREIWFNAEEKVYVIEGRMFTSGRMQ